MPALNASSPVRGQQCAAFFNTPANQSLPRKHIRAARRACKVPRKDVVAAAKITHWFSASSPSSPATPEQGSPDIIPPTPLSKSKKRRQRKTLSAKKPALLQPSFTPEDHGCPSKEEKESSSPSNPSIHGKSANSKKKAQEVIATAPSRMTNRLPCMQESLDMKDVQAQSDGMTGSGSLGLS